MKKLLLPILFLLLVLPAMSQIQLTVQGTVTDLSNGNPIPNQAVNIHNDSNSGFYFYHTVYTNSSGFFSDVVAIQNGATQGNLYVNTVDCQNFLQQQWFTYNPAQTSFTATFAICYNANPCQAGFTYPQYQPLTVAFADASTGGGTTRLWSFGDGTTSTLMNPTHTFPQAGWYNVTLTIGALGTTCYDSATQYLYVWDSIIGGCQAGFYSVADSLNSNSLHFFNQSTGNINSWQWDFGDPATGSNNYSTLQNPSHTYSLPGVYTTCLTVHGVDSTCYDMTCQTVVIAGGGGCQADFVIYPDSNSINSFQFVSQSIGNINTYTWSFGDGTGQTVTFPQNPNVSHIYAMAGTYYVCLTIQGANNCYDVVCDTLVVGFNTGCIANFTYSDSNNVANTIQFMDLSLASGGTPITSWSWDFGDPASGLNNTSSLQNPTHVFSSQGSYTVCLTIHGADSSCFDTYCQTIVISGGGGCMANFTYTCTVPGGKTVQFTDLSSGSPTSWSWVVDNTLMSTLQNPVYTFPSGGTYTVCLTIAGNNCSSTFCQTIIIQDSVNYHQVYGQVFAGNFPITTGLAMIFSLDTLGNYNPYVDVALLDSNGVYYFTQVPDGNYYILAIPLDPMGYLPTYYGNSISWQQATLIGLGTPANPYNISLVAADQMIAGPGSTSGQINMAGLKSSMTDKINMIIMNEQSNPIGFTNVSTTGSFSFPSLAYGTYYLHPEMPGVISDVVKIVLTPETPHAEVVMTFTGSKILGLKDEVSLVNQWLVYPNPITDRVTIDLDLKQNVEALAEIRNLSGQVIMKQNVTLKSGKNVNSFSTSDLPAGMYILRIFSPDGINIHTTMVKNR